MNNFSNNIYAHKLLDSIIKQAEELEFLKQATHVMKNNDDFMNFVSNTNLGSKVYSEWQSLVNLILNNLYTELSYLSNITRTHLSNEDSKKIM